MPNERADSKNGPEKDQRPLRMAQLVARSGVPKSTILYYLSEGLLPEPQRPKPNVALYDPICVDLIQYIKAAQEIHRYPMSWIRDNVKSIMADTPPEELLHLGRRILGKPTKFHSADETAKAVGIDASDLRRYVELGLVWPLNDMFDEYDQRQAELLANAERAGIPADELLEAAHHIRLFHEAAQRIIRNRVSNPFDPRTAAVLVELFGYLQSYLTRRYMEGQG